MFVLLRFEESLPAGDPLATQPARLLRNWRDVLGHPGFRAWAALLCAGWGALFFVVAGSPFVYLGLFGVSRIGFGAILAASAAAYTAGTLGCRLLLRRRGLRATALPGAVCMLAGGLGLLAAAAADATSPWALVLAQWVVAFGYGIVQPCAQVGTVAPFPARAGTAASLSGFSMMAVAFAVGITLAATPPTSALPMAMGVALGCMLATAVALTLVRRDGDPPPC
jgi:DHA1 family bicyclomycin/chloramphenicol resistance-like MFS transporter